MKKGTIQKLVCVVAGVGMLIASQPVRAASGWYLFSPYAQVAKPGQGDDGSDWPNLYNEPWHQDGAYDTAAECNKARWAAIKSCEGQIDQLQGWIDGRDPVWGDRLKNDGKALLKAHGGCPVEDAAVCMASDDPRLPGNRLSAQH